LDEIEQIRNNLPNILDQYNKELKEAKEDLELEGKNLVTANRELASKWSYYDQRRISLKKLIDYMELEVNRVRAKLWRSYTEKSDLVLSDRTKDKYIDGEPAFITAYSIYLELKEVFDQYVSITKALEMRGYQLRNITELRVASLDNVEV